MDYNDSDYEGQNLHITSEESSKISSVLRPFSLPKFDFDDSLHGHLRFDSLVENEVFLGIPSQQDNHWIEDFSRGSSGIEFSSSAVQSCALLRRNNVWSEATSSESVEMLLKSVGHEEMIPGETMIEGSDPGDQLVSPTGQMDTDLSLNDKTDNVGVENFPVLPAIQSDFSDLIQSAGGEGLNAERTLEIEETKNSSFGVCIDSKTSSLVVISGTCVDNKESSLVVNNENLNISVKATSGNNQGEASGLGSTSDSNQGESSILVKVPLSEQVQVPLLRMETGDTESFIKKVTLSARGSGDQDRISDISFVDSSCINEGIVERVEEPKEPFNTNNEGLEEIAAKSASPEPHCPLEIPAKLESSNEEHALEAETDGASDMAGNVGFTYRAEVDDEGAHVVEHSGGSDCGTAMCSVSQVGRQSEGSVIVEETSNPFQTRGGIDVTEPEQAPDIQPSGCLKDALATEDICAESNNTVDTSHTVMSTLLPEVIGKPSKQDTKSNIKQADKYIDSSLASECCSGISMIENLRAVRGAFTSQKEILENEDHVPRPLAAGSIHACGEDSFSVKEVVHEHELYEKDSENFPLDSSNMISDGNERASGSDSLDEAVKVTVETTVALQSNSTYQVSNTEVEDTNRISSCIEHDPSAGCHANESHACKGFLDQRKETGLKDNEDSSVSTAVMSLKMGDELSAAAGSGVLDSAAEEEKKKADHLVVDSSSVILYKANEKLNEEIENSAREPIVQDKGSEDVPDVMSVEVELETSSRVLVGSFDGESNIVHAPGLDCADISLNEKNKQDRKGSNVENVGEDLLTPRISGANAPFEEVETFTFDVRPLSQSGADSGKGLQSLPRSQACKLSTKSVEGSSSASGGNQTVPIADVKLSPGSSLMPSDEPSLAGGGKALSERKRRRSGKSGKDSAKKGVQEKETTPLRQILKGGKSTLTLSPLGAGQFMKFESAVKPRGPVPNSTSSLPDLNTSASLSVFSLQPFTDSQQVQLRAQIFVYGSLIQGAAPDEACMVSAFDGCRSVWESSWRTCVERLHGQKSQGKSNETPLQPRSGVKASEQSSSGFPHGEVLSSPVGRSNNKPLSLPVVNSVIPLSSPLWNMSTPSSEAVPSSSMVRCTVAVSPLHPYQTSPLQNLVAHTTSWPSQAPFPVPWLISSQSSSFDISASYSGFPITEPVKLTPVKETSLPISGTKNLSSVTAMYGGPISVFPGTSSVDLKKASVSGGQTSADTKSRKRKKSIVAENVAHIPVTASTVDTVATPFVSTHLLDKVLPVGNLYPISLVARNQTDLRSTPALSCHYSTSVAVSTPSSLVPKINSNQFLQAVPPSFSTNQPARSDLSMDKGPLNLESLSKVEAAKLQAEEAATHAAAAISHCQCVWSQLDQHKNAGMTSEAEAKLASAAVALAAAASVAKAAAAAAKIASTAAMQAKQMADEAVSKTGIVKTNELLSSSANNLNATPVSNLKGVDMNNVSSLAITAAREAARKRVEAASAATMHAENLDAILKASELAAEAVSHAGKIVAMGDPLSLSELVEAGPDGYWKVSRVSTVPGSIPNGMTENQANNSNAGGMPNVPMEQLQGPDKDTRVAGHSVNPSERVLSGDNVNDYIRSSIKEGSVVEVLKDFGDLKNWFSADVISLKAGEAFVSYRELQAKEGSGQLKEWVLLEAKDGNAPIIRIPHPMTALQLDGTRKRRRAAARDFTWSVGDKVDAWMQDCWREGIVAEKDKKDATAVIVHFPAQGEKVNVKIWHLRPTVIWSDGQWIEWSRAVEDDISKGDTPAGKRPKYGTANFGSQEQGKMPQNLDSTEKNEPILPLSASEKTFDIGTTRGDNKPSGVRTMRSGLQKQGPRVVFGVPKAGKTRKLMDVSKHHVSDRSTETNVPDDSVKLAKFFTPKGTGSRGLKNNSKPNIKEKQPAEAKPKSLKAGKPPSIPSRTLSRKDKTASSQLNVSGASLADHKLKGSVSNDEDETREQNRTGVASFSNVEEISGSTVVFSSKALSQENPKKVSTMDTKSERPDRGTHAPPSGKWAKIECSEKPSEVVEPRRSNRRIQPTSRLLEGLQSSLIISKIPSSHDKGQKGLSKGSSRGNSRG